MRTDEASNFKKFPYVIKKTLDVLSWTFQFGSASFLLGIWLLRALSLANITTAQVLRDNGGGGLNVVQAVGLLFLSRQELNRTLWKGGHESIHSLRFIARTFEELVKFLRHKNSRFDLALPKYNSG